MQMEVNDKTADALRRLAEAGGFRSPADALDVLVDQAARRQHAFQTGKADKTAEPPATYEEWETLFADLLTLARPRNPAVDDSRESIYPVR